MMIEIIFYSITDMGYGEKHVIATADTPELAEHYLIELFANTRGYIYLSERDSWYDTYRSGVKTIIHTVEDMWIECYGYREKKDVPHISS
jgi:hypothetical protein